MTYSSVHFKRLNRARAANDKQMAKRHYSESRKAERRGGSAHKGVKDGK